LQRRGGALTATGFAKGLESFAKYGLWNVDLRTQHDNAATNNSAPLVMYALDQRIQRETAGKKRLDDVVVLLAERGGELDTEDFREAAEKVAGTRLGSFFERHVRRGERPGGTARD
jgi:predicted metalloprotease with PDZ domain